MVELAVYESKYKALWDDFVRRSKNGSFLFYRDYMEYHSDRFIDSSLLFFKEDALIAVMPANLNEGVLYSHQGLTFGGIISGKGMKIGLMLELFAVLMDYLTQQLITKTIYKPVPHIYHLIPAEEDLYALFRCNAKLVRRDVSTAVLLNQRMEFSKEKRRRIKLCKDKGLIVKRTYDFRTYMAIVSDVIGQKYKRFPTHSADEMVVLSSRFPEHIKLFGAYEGETMLAGAVVYENKSVAHLQYNVSSGAGQKVGAGELVWDYLINHYYNRSDKLYFDFGISTEQGGRYLNAGLIAYKEWFGARATMYDTYEIDVADNPLQLNFG
ncbi:MAG: GNAT family N-acetyltransferase [Halobacteriota archaeon]